MANFIIPPEEFFASVGEPGGNYANSISEWKARTQERIGITVSQSADIEIKECSRCKCFHAGKCVEDRENRLLEDSL